jgi:nucleotide-binding universal stress UspA family protein
MDISGHTQKRVLLAVDDSESSVRAARTAHDLFGDDAEYSVISVASTTPLMWGEDVMGWGVAYTLALPPPGHVGTTPFVLQQIDSAAQTARDIAAEADVPVAHVVGDEGDAAHAIVKAAHEFGIDVIVVGSSDRSWFSRLVMPSTAAALMRESDIPVLVAP